MHVCGSIYVWELYIFCQRVKAGTHSGGRELDLQGRSSKTLLIDLEN